MRAGAKRSGDRAGCGLAPLQDVAGWVDHYRRFWEESFDRLDDYLQEMKQKESKK